MAIATALPGFNDLGRLSPHLSKNEQKINAGSLKKFKISVHGTSNSAILRLQGV